MAPGQQFILQGPGPNSYPDLENLQKVSATEFRVHSRPGLHPRRPACHDRLVHHSRGAMMHPPARRVLALGRRRIAC